MRFLILFGTLFLALNAGAETPVSSLWTALDPALKGDGMMR